VCEIWKSVAIPLVQVGYVAWRTVRSLLRRLVWPGSNEESGLLELRRAQTLRRCDLDLWPQASFACARPTWSVQPGNWCSAHRSR